MTHWQCEDTWATHKLNTSPEVSSGWRESVLAAAVSSKFSGKEEVCSSDWVGSVVGVLAGALNDWDSIPGQGDVPWM